MKMKVKVTKLQDAIEKHVAQEKKRFARENEAYEKSMEAVRVRYIENVEKYLSDLKDGADIRDNYGLGDWLKRGIKWPAEPRKAETHTDLLVKLDLTEDQILVVDDHSDYMKFLSGKCVCR